MQDQGPRAGDIFNAAGSAAIGGGSAIPANCELMGGKGGCAARDRRKNGHQINRHKFLEGNRGEGQKGRRRVIE